MILIGHRGAAAEAPENTLAGFDHAWELGIRDFEFDLRLSSDGRVVVMHDETVDRTTTGSGRVDAMSADEVIRLTACGPDGTPTSATVPSLDAVLDRLSEADLLFLELKSEDRAIAKATCREVARLVNDTPLAPRIVVTGWTKEVMAIAGEYLPNIQRGLLTMKDDLAEQIPVALEAGCTWFLPQHQRCDRDTVTAAKKQGLRVAIWTVNNVERAKEIQQWNADAIMTDHPGAFLAAGIERE